MLRHILRSDELEASFAPGAGMVCFSLLHRGEELLGQRGGLEAYVERGSTMGIPLLYPWANRLGALRYAAGGQRVALDPETQPLRLDANGLPIHGLLAASPHWELEEAGETALVARFDFGARPELLAAFPFPHELRVEARLEGVRLEIATEVRANGGVAVPLAFGWHPYLRLPGVPRAEWLVELPVRRHAELDERGIPAGRAETVKPERAPLGERGFDDLYPSLAEPPLFALEGGGRRIELELGAGYPVAQVYAPPEQELICFEPMAAPTNALVTGERLRLVEPGTGERATFAVSVSG